MKYVGIDLHKKTIRIYVVNQERKKLEYKRLYFLPVETIVAFFRTLGEFEMVVEATASYEWFARLIEARKAWFGVSTTPVTSFRACHPPGRLARPGRAAGVVASETHPALAQTERLRSWHPPSTGKLLRHRIVHTRTLHRSDALKEKWLCLRCLLTAGCRAS
jgi:hypothetical protein